MNPHVCGPQCRAIYGLVEAHERSRLSARRKRLAKLHGRRPKARWTGARGPKLDISWVDEMWAIVEAQ